MWKALWGSKECILEKDLIEILQESVPVGKIDTYTNSSKTGCPSMITFMSKWFFSSSANKHGLFLVFYFENVQGIWFIEKKNNNNQPQTSTWPQLNFILYSGIVFAFIGNGLYGNLAIWHASCSQRNRKSRHEARARVEREEKVGGKVLLSRMPRNFHSRDA